ncbi:MAG: carbon-nitrogen hydrolase family protein [Eubacteriales bacterium]|nr:carbon-nitrogen hydrolase family protein [Eubacteriales bacterium]
MRIALAQMAMSADEKENLIRSLKLLEEAEEGGADLILYPEVQLTPFFAQFPANIGGCCGGGTGPRALSARNNPSEESVEESTEEGKPFDSAEAHYPGEGIPEIKAFRKLCRKHAIMASPNFYYEENGKNYDASFLIDRNGDVTGVQKMVHIVEVPQFYEQDYYTPSDDGFHVFETDAGRIGVVVCFDRHYPESVRTEAVMGAELVLIPTANVKAEPIELFEQEVRVQAYQNECFIAMCNRTGREAGMDFCGRSVVIGPDGDICARAGEGEELLFADIDIGRVSRTREQRPYLSLRRPEWYR